jgi:hypothetical protein
MHSFRKLSSPQSLLAAALALAGAWLALSVSAVAAHAETEGPGWALTAQMVPTNLAPGANGSLEIGVFNVGARESTGTVTVTDTLPPGITATVAGALRIDVEEAVSSSGVTPQLEGSYWDCTGNGGGTPPHVAGATIVTCTNSPESLPNLAGGAGYSAPHFVDAKTPMPPIGIGVTAAAGTPETLVPRCGGSGAPQCNHVTVAGGGAAGTATIEDGITVSRAAPHFGVADLSAWFSNADGTRDLLAGSHPYAAVLNYDLASEVVPESNGNGEWELRTAGGEQRTLRVKLPAGLVGAPDAAPRCQRSAYLAERCPRGSLIGVVLARFTVFPGAFEFGLYSVVPRAGVPAEFAFTVKGIHAYIVPEVRSGGDYGLTTTVNDSPERSILGATIVIWGDAAAKSHEAWVEPNNCKVVGAPQETGSCAPAPESSMSFLTLPTSCGAPPVTSMFVNSWQEPVQSDEVFSTQTDAAGVPAGFSGCESLGFAPGLVTAPDTARADSPTGLSVEVKPPLGSFEEQEGLSTADIQDTKVVLPEGLVINPGQAAGLQACGAGEDGLTSEAERAVGEEDNGPAHCPNASKVGVVSIHTPLLEGTTEPNLEGNVYVLDSNPPDLKLLVAASADGVNLKLVGNVHLNTSTGRLETTFEGTPQLPFTDFKLSFSGGPQAALDTPTHCGTYTTNADFSSWAIPFVPDFLSGASFDLAEGPGGSGCPAATLPFSPELTAGATTDKAGAFSGFTMLLSRGDGQQRIEKLSFKMPAGLAGLISNVPVCGEPQAAQGTCPSSSRIGHTVVTSGPGPYPLVIPQPGDPEAAIYLTGPYGGAPFGLSIVTPVIAGPFNLGTIVTRAKIEVNPLTAQITVATDPLPQIVDGVPTDLRSVYAVIDRSGFMFNPTSCSPQTISGTAWSTAAPGQSEPAETAGLSTQFGIGSCRELAFAPKLTVSTSGKTSKANGAGLQVKLVAPHEGPTAPGDSEEANLTRVKVDLPKQLPSRLTTLQQACTASQFAANPAGCPVGSKIGTATVTTSVLPVPLTGPVIFVSHGGEAFPSLTMVLQGDNVTVEVVGTTFISHAGITSTTFKTVPDVPFSTFTLTLPQGKYSALAANGNLCKSKLAMPTEFLAQNGLKINQSTPIAVTGCPKPRKTKAKHHKKKHKTKK